MGFVGVVSMFWACSSETVLTPDYGEQAATNSSSSTPSNGNGGSVNEDPGNKPSQSSTSKDTTVIHETVKLSSSSHPSPYSSSGTFCWSNECKNNAAAYVPTSSSSAPSIEVTMSAEAQLPQLPPIVTGNTSMTDQRDNKTYKLKMVAGTLWMAENINLELKSGYYCSVEGSEKNYCNTYGGYYTLAAANKVCPEGWRLPTYDEFTAAYNETDEEFWALGGRFKLETNVEFGQTEEQGYIWLGDEQYNNVQIQKSATKPLSASGRAYNVRCVQGNS